MTWFSEVCLSQQIKQCENKLTCLILDQDRIIDWTFLIGFFVLPGNSREEDQGLEKTRRNDRLWCFPLKKCDKLVNIL